MGKISTGNPHGIGQGQMNPTSLDVEEMAKLLSGAGQKRITTEQVQADIDAGAPVGGDGRMNLVHYAAWLAREVQRQ